MPDYSACSGCARCVTVVAECMSFRIYDTGHQVSCNVSTFQTSVQICLCLVVAVIFLSLIFLCRFEAITFIAFASFVPVTALRTINSLIIIVESSTLVQWNNATDSTRHFYQVAIHTFHELSVAHGSRGYSIEVIKHDDDDFAMQQ